MFTAKEENVSRNTYKDRLAKRDRQTDRQTGK